MYKFLVNLFITLYTDNSVFEKGNKILHNNQF